MTKILKNFLCIFALTFFMQTGIASASSTGSEDLKKTNSQDTVSECFEGASRAIFKFNHALDGAIFEPVAKGYRTLPVGLRKGTSNVIDNLRSLLTLSNNVLQGDFAKAGHTVGRFVVNSTVGILGIWDPASALGLKDYGEEDFGQTLGSWGTGTGCYFVLPILGPTTARDAVGLIGNTFLDPVYHITHNSEVYNRSLSEHNYWYYRGTDAVDFRAKNIESFNSVEENSIDLYATFKSLYLQDRSKKVTNSTSVTKTQDDSDWEEIDTN